MKKRIINIIFYLVMIGCIFLLIYFNRDYKNIDITNKNYNKYRDYKFVSLDLSDAEINRLSYKVNKDEYNVYTIKMSDKYLLVYLNKNTALTKSVNVIKYKDDSYSKDIKSSLENDSDKQIKYLNGYYSNIDYQYNKTILDFKKYISYVMIGLIAILIIKDIIMLIKKV